MKVSAVLQSWKAILDGRQPSLSIEITKECPLRCPGCYAYEEGHLGGGVMLRELSDYRGEALIEGVLRIVEERKPLHVSLVGGDPLVRFRELEVLVPKLTERGVHVQVVTSAFRPIPIAWASLPFFHVSVSIDGLREDHDIRRAPATYDRILKNIAGHKITVHCTVTAQMAGRPGYLEEFVRFWSEQESVGRIWFSLFTPQRGADLPEILNPAQRRQVLDDLLALRKVWPKIDMPEPLLAELAAPPASPDECIFARTTTTLSADLRTEIGPCQFGGDPDCSQCGCYASAGLAAIGNHRLGGVLRVGSLLELSRKIGVWRAGPKAPAPAPQFPILR